MGPFYDARHLAGQHDQSTHGNRGGGGSYSPGNWSKASTKAEVDRIAAMLEAELSDSIKQRMIERDGPDAIRNSAEEMVGRSTRTTYLNGEHTVRFTSNKLTEQHHKELLSQVDTLQTLAPVDGPLNLTVAPSSEFGRGVGGETVVGEGTIRLSDRLYVGYDAEGALWTSGMPIAREVKASEYVLVHEWGHAVDNRAPVKDAGPLVGGTIEGLSDYGRTSSNESFAEAFAEFALTRGQTDNVAAQTYADIFGWGERWPSLSTTSS